MRRMISKHQIRRFLPAHKGATAIEYALIAAGVAGANGHGVLLSRFEHGNRRGLGEFNRTRAQREQITVQR